MQTQNETRNIYLSTQKLNTLSKIYFLYFFSLHLCIMILILRVTTSKFDNYFLISICQKIMFLQYIIIT